MKLFIIFIFSTISNWNSSFMYFTFYKIQRYRNFLCKNYLLSKHIMLALCTCAALGTLQHQRGWCLFILTKEARILLWLQRIAAHPMRRSRLWCADRSADALAYASIWCCIACQFTYEYCHSKSSHHLIMRTWISYMYLNLLRLKFWMLDLRNIRPGFWNHALSLWRD